MSPPVFLLSVPELANAQSGSVVDVTGSEGRHAVTVVRVKPGEVVDLVDGVGRRATGAVAAVSGAETFTVRIDQVIDSPEPDVRFHVVQALPKSDRGELAVELMTEIGVDVVTPWAAERCVTRWKADRAERAHRKWCDSAMAAAKQSRRCRVPRISALATSSEVCSIVESAALALLLDEEASSPLADITPPISGDIVLIVGPEGGVSTSEATAFVAAGARAVALGSNILRTSTAGAAALAALAVITGRWSETPGAMGG